MQRQVRLRHSADFERVRAQGRSWRHPFFTMAVAPNDLPHNRYGFITSRRVGGAVKRNRVRRLLREVIRQLAIQLKPGFDIVFITRNEIVGEPYSTISTTVRHLVGRAGLLEAIDLPARQVDAKHEDGLQ